MHYAGISITPPRICYVRERRQPLEEQRIEIDVPVDMTLRRAPTVRDLAWGASVGMGLRWTTERVHPLQTLAESGA
jgi:hypothetical protein